MAKARSADVNNDVLVQEKNFEPGFKSKKWLLLIIDQQNCFIITMFYLILAQI